MEDKLITKKEAAEFLNVSLSTINRYMKDGKIRFIKLGRQVRFNKENLIEDIQQQQGLPAVVQSA